MIRHWQRLLRAEWCFVLLCAIFAIAASMAVCTWFAHQINPDATSYFTIAEKYARFDMRHAINGYWGPLFSWLLVPAVWVGLGPELDSIAKLILVAAGVGTLGLLYYFLRSHGASRTLGNGICVALMPMLFGWVALGAVSPDLVFTFLIVGFAIVLERFWVQPSRNAGFLLGAIGALMYFTKGIGLYLFVVVMGCVAIWQWWRTRNYRQVVRRFWPVAVSCGLLVVPFIVVLSLKYDQFTISTTGTYVQRVFGPAMRGEHLMLSKGPLAPPNETAHTIWEDPSAMLPSMPVWNPFSPAGNRMYFLHDVVWRNVDVTIQAIKDAGAFSAVAVVAMIAGCVARGSTRFRRSQRLLAMIAGVLAVAYVMVYTEPRYLWPVLILAVMAFGLWLVQMERKGLLGRAQIVLAVCGIVAVVLPPMIPKLHDLRASSSDLYRQATQDLRRHIPAHARVIADNFIEYHTCYYLDLRCFAVLQTPPVGGEADYYARLKVAGVTHFVNYHSRDADPRLRAFIDSHFTKTATIRSRTVHPLTPVLITVYRLR